MAEKKISRKAKVEKYKAEKVNEIAEYFKSKSEDVVQTKSNELAFPWTDEDGEEEWLKILIQVPNGSRDGEPYDGYGEAESFKMKLESDKEKAAEKAAAKEKKIARDEKYRAQKAANKAAEEKRHEEKGE